jgi:hypothetical protein
VLSGGQRPDREGNPLPGQLQPGVSFLPGLCDDAGSINNLAYNEALLNALIRVFIYKMLSGQSLVVWL